MPSYRCPRVLLLAVLALFALLAAACGDSEDDVESTPATATATATTLVPDGVDEPDDPEPTPEPTTEPTPEPTAESAEELGVADMDFGPGFGSYEVGVQTLQLPSAPGRDRPLTVDIWYPLIEGSSADLAAFEYTFLPGTFYPSEYAVGSTPDLISADGPFPLVVYSHGSGGLRYIHANYTEAIASNGYVVVSADHTGNTAVELLTGASTEFAETALNRADDVTALLDAFLMPGTAETEAFVASIDPESVAVTGHSFGGFSALASAGGYANDLGASAADPRIDAIVLLAGASGLMSDEQLMAVEVPTLMITGSDDKTTPVDPNVTRPWELLSSEIVHRVELVAAEHQTFTDVCAYQEFLPSLTGVLPQIVELIDSYALEACAPGDMPIPRAQSLTNTFAVAFFDSVLLGEPAIDLLEVDEQADLIYQIRTEAS